jgi:TonB family protein
MKLRTFKLCALPAFAFFTTLLFSSQSISQTGPAEPPLNLPQVPEENLLPCDELEQKVIEQASPEEVARITAYQPAEPLRRVDPRYPKSAARDGKEGWVLMSFVIDEEGLVQDPVIEDFAGDRTFRRSALNAIRNWTFTPAMKDGKPTQQCDAAVRLDFSMADPGGASRKFVKSYKQAVAYVADKDIDKAEKILDKLESGNDSNRYENAWMSSLDTRIAEQLGDDARELRAIKRTLSNSLSHSKEKEIFNAEYIDYLRQRQFILETNLGQYADALATAKTIAELENGESLISPLKSVIEEVEGFILSDEHIILSVDMPESGAFFHSLVRNQFAFADIQGELETVEVRCETHREKFTVAEEFVWSIPEDWGQCRVMVTGEQDTKFMLVEVNKI